MAVGCGPSVSKIILTIFNFVFLLIGGAVLGLGIWVVAMNPLSETDMNEMGAVAAGMIYILAYIIIGLGGFIFLVSFLGCCGALSENKCMLGCYVCLVFLLALLVATVGGVLIFAMTTATDTIEGAIDQTFADIMKDPLINHTQAGSNVYTPLGKTLQALQFTSKCCGRKGPLDYKGHHISQLGFPVLPSCCKVKGDSDINSTHVETLTVNDWKTCSQEALTVFSTGSTNYPGANIKELYTDGCSAEWLNVLPKVKTFVILVTAFIVAFEILCIIMAICLCTNVGEERSSVY